MLNKSIAYQLSIYISLAVISVFIAFIAIFISLQKDSLKKNTENEAIGISSRLIMTVDNYLLATREITSNIAEQIVYYAEHDDAELFISKLIDKYPYLNAIHVNIDSTVPNLNYHNYFIIRDKDSVNYEQHNSAIYDCPYEKKIIERVSSTKKPGWAEPFQCPINDMVVVSYYSPIYHQNEDDETTIVGEVFCELSLLQLNNILNAEKIGERGIAMLIARNGDFITHPKKEWILKKNVSNLSNKVFGSKEVDQRKLEVKEALLNQQSGSTIVYAELFNFEKTWVYYTPVSNIGWSLIIAIPYQELYEPMYLPILQMLFFSVLGILIIYLVVTYISSRQIQPLSELTAQLKKFSSLTGDVGNISENEVDRIQESLSYIKLWYEKYKINLSEEVVKSKNRMRDISQASEIQRSFIKMDFPAFPDRTDIDLYATYKPAKGVSGDLFDYFFIDDYHLVFCIGDVSGKGVPAAFFMSVAQTIIKNNSKYLSAKKITEETSKELYTSNKHQFFLTLFLGVLNIETGELTYCNAAHTAAYTLNNNGKLLKLSDSHGLPLGLYPDKEYGETKIHLREGDSIILYTDGVTELHDQNSLQYGNQKLEENLLNLTGRNPKEMVEKIEKSLKVFIGETIQSDDISILILKYKP